jgi:hypothetical protein
MAKKRTGPKIRVKCPPNAKLEVCGAYVFFTYPDHRPRRIPVMELVQEAIVLGDGLDLFALGTEQWLE